MQPASHRLSSALLMVFCLSSVVKAVADPVPLKRVVELALTHSTSAASAEAMAQRAYSSYRETKNQYLPTLVVGSGLGYTQGYPLSLEGSAPSIVNTTAQSTVFNAALRDFVRESRTQWQATTVRSKDERDQLIGHGSELCRTQQMGVASGSSGRRVLSSSENGATGQRTNPGRGG